MTTDEKDPKVQELGNYLNTRISAAFMTGRLGALEEAEAHIGQLFEQVKKLRKEYRVLIAQVKNELKQKKNLIPPL